MAPACLHQMYNTTFRMDHTTCRVPASNVEHYFPYVCVKCIKQLSCFPPRFFGALNVRSHVRLWPTVRRRALTPAYMHTYIHTCMHACKHTYIHTYTHTYIQSDVVPSLRRMWKAEDTWKDAPRIEAAFRRHAHSGLRYVDSTDIAHS